MGKIKRVSFEVTGKCNLNCFYCCRGYLNTKDMVSSEMSIKDILKIIDDAKKDGCESFLFTGGEAFIKEGFEEILKACEGYFVEVYSNGTLITSPENLNLIEKYVSRLTVTVDGLSSHNFYRKGSDYNDILENIRIVKEKIPKVNIKINTMANGRSVPELPQLYNRLKEVNIDQWHIDFPQLRGRLAEFDGSFSADYEDIANNSKEVIKKYYEDDKPFYLKIYKVFSSSLEEDNFIELDMSENPCAYKTDCSMFINAEGKYILCPSIPSQDVTIANIDTDSYSEALIKKDNLDFQKIQFKELHECLDCRYFDLCMGGCRGEAKVLSDSFLGADLNACSLMEVAERIIYPSLPEKISKVYLNKINEAGKFPRVLKNLDEMKGDLQKKYSSVN